MKKALLRTTGGPSQSFRYETRSDIIDSLAASAAQLGEWREALAYRELKASNYNSTTIFQGIFAQRNRLQLLVARGAVAMEEGNLLKAVRSFSEAHQMLPGDGYLANELFPLMREMGLIELHDQLFAESARLCRENIRRYPEDDNVYNNFAWQAGRANRALDEAEEYLKKALEMNPHSAAYLDTMGEIYFARKNRAEAIKWSEKSLENDILGNSSNRWELQQQNRRFKSGAFPVQ
jgi:tetratricopeptide (TPR) repeat protein